MAGLDPAIHVFVRQAKKVRRGSPDQARCKRKKHASKLPRVRRALAAFPHANGFNGFLRALGEPGFIVTIASAMRQHRRSLGTSIGVSGPHDFAVRFDAARRDGTQASIASRAQRS